ncbi:MAG: DUF3089 domain-containing protein [Halioglobus sp.]|nr:DUF3089 domain-containing protein [Halioglobus sp.]
MRWIKRVLLAVVALLTITLAALLLSGKGDTVRLVWDFNFSAPDQPFDPKDTAAPPDYALEKNWAALPHREDLANIMPPGLEREVEQGKAPVDVFFVHPTGFLKGHSWTFSMDPATSTEENTQWMIVNQAGAFNGCCNIYAPRYRQASIFTYFNVDETTRDQVLAFAYQDVARAFDYYLEHYNDGRPVMLASHSQGTHHAIRLLREKIDRTPLARRLVAAYLIGGGLKTEEFSGLRDISLCDSPRELGCAVHWDTFSMAVLEDAENTGNVCTNPLTWKLNGGLAHKGLHVGAVASAGEYFLRLSGDDSARGVRFDDMGAPVAHLVEAQCRGGRLYITDQTHIVLGGSSGLDGNYHGLDYAVFYMDIRENARLRVTTYLVLDHDH